MNRLILVGSCLVFLSVTVLAQEKPAVSNETKEVFATIVRWSEAFRDRDMKTLEALFADDAVITLSDGRVRGKAEEVEALKPDPNIKTISVVNEDIGVKRFGDVAVVTALTRMDYVAGGKDSSLAMRYTAVFVKKDGRWQIVALQTGRAPQGKAAK